MDTNNDKAQDLIAALEWEKRLKREYTVDEVLKTEKDRGITIGFVGASIGRQTDIRNLLTDIEKHPETVEKMFERDSRSLVFTDEALDACPIDKFRNEARRKELERLKKERKQWKLK